MTIDDVYSHKLAEATERLSLLAEEARLTAESDSRGASLITAVLASLTEAIKELHAADEELAAGQAELAQTRADYADLFESAPDAYVVTDFSGTIRNVNQRTELVLRYPRDDLVGWPMADLVAGEDKPSFHTFLTTVHDQRSGSFDLTMTRHDGRNVPIAARAVTRGRAGEQPEIRWLLRDESDRRTLQERLVREATTDELTGIPNRPYFMNSLDHLVDRASDTGEQLAVLFIDLDGFKTVNDRFGHQAGDEVLRRVAMRIRHSLRGGDVLGRVGGDEFAVVLRSATRAGALRAAERIRRSLEAEYPLTDGSTNVTASIGVAVVAHSDSRRMLQEADKAMYDAKSEGRNRCVVFGGEIEPNPQA